MITFSKEMSLVFLSETEIVPPGIIDHRVRAHVVEWTQLYYFRDLVIAQRLAQELRNLSYSFRRILQSEI